MKARFNAAREALPIALPAGILAILLVFLLGRGPLALVSLAPGLVLIYAMYFFRDPRRHVPTGEPGLVVAAADGRVVAIEDLAESAHYAGPCKRISIFLSLFDVHINRAPIEGTVQDIQYRPGKRLDARKAETTDVNEANSVYLDTAYGPVTVRQIAGLVARRIVCRCEVGERLLTGERFGMIKFGSRTEIYLPANVDVRARVGEMVKAGESVVAKFP